MVKHQFQDTAKAFSKESPNLPSIPPLMDCSQGFYWNGGKFSLIYFKSDMEMVTVIITLTTSFIMIISESKKLKTSFQSTSSHTAAANNNNITFNNNKQQGQQGQPFLQQQQRGIGVASGMQNQQHQFAPQHQGQPQGPGQTPQPPGSATNANFLSICHQI